jgi:threonine dehydrogenase-like Zn-dependent dehydrogenase
VAALPDSALSASVEPEPRAWTLGVAAPGRPAFFPRDVTSPEDGGFTVETLFSGLSAGTELSFVKGTNPALGREWDPERGLFDDAAPGTGYPVERMGYMEVGRVVDSRSDALHAGDLVAMRYGHADGHTAAPGELAVPLPAGLDPVLGVLVAHMGPICANGVLHAAAEEPDGPHDLRLADGVRDRVVLVVGAGVVGLLTGLFARRHGAAEVAVADPTPDRLRAAARLGLIPVDESEVDAWRWAKDRWVHGARDRGADVVFQCRGLGRALAAALRSLRPQRTVIDLAFYQEGAADVRLGEEFHHNGLGVRCAQIGRVPRRAETSWDRHRLADATLDLLLAEGEALRDALVTDIVPVRDAPSFVADLAARRRQTLQAVFAGPAVIDGRSACSGTSSG